MGYTEFGCENLEVWNLSVNFSKCVIKAVDDINCDRKHYRLIVRLQLPRILLKVKEDIQRKNLHNIFTLHAAHFMKHSRF